MPVLSADVGVCVAFSPEEDVPRGVKRLHSSRQTCVWGGGVATVEFCFGSVWLLSSMSMPHLVSAHCVYT